MKVQEIQIDFLYFRFMSKEKPIKKGRIGSTSELDSKVHRIYARYISNSNTGNSRKGIFLR